MTPAKPSLDLLRSLSDEHVLRALMSRRRATRAEIAAATGLSKPTVSESVRRLEAAAAVVDTGERTSGPGRVGTYYALAVTSGCGLVVSLAAEGIVAEAIDVYGDVVARAQTPITDAQPVDRILDSVATEVAQSCSGPVRLAVVSAAEPVDRRTGRLLELPDAPLVLGALDPPALLSGLVEGAVAVDNDVNWAARTELTSGRAIGLRDFVYVFLGEGIGCAAVTDGEVRRGHTGVAGELAHVLTTGPGQRAMRLTEAFDALGLRRPHSKAIDVPALLRAIEPDTQPAADLLQALADAIAGVLSAALALADPAVVLIGGPWGRHPKVLRAVTARFTRAPRHVAIKAAMVTDEPALTGARHEALRRLRDATVASAARHAGPPTQPV